MGSASGFMCELSVTRLLGSTFDFYATTGRECRNPTWSLYFGPDEKMFYQIFVNQAQALGYPDVDKDSFLYFLNEWYRKTGKPLQSVHPRDILKAVKVLCEYAGEPLHMTPTLIKEACEGYFVKAKSGEIL